MKIICPFISIFLTKNNAANFLDEHLPFDYTENRIKINFRKECIFMTDKPQTLSCIDCAAKACKKGEAEKYPAFCLTKNMDPAPVSYTHLDVYKRQLLYIKSKSIFMYKSAYWASKKRAASHYDCDCRSLHNFTQLLHI